MKSQALKRAWELFKKYQMTFSQALIEGWKFAKRLFIKQEFAKTSSEEVTYRAKLVKRFNELKEIIYLPKGHNSERVVVNNFGAALYYDGKTFNND